MIYIKIPIVGADPQAQRLFVISLLITVALLGLQRITVWPLRRLGA